MPELQSYSEALEHQLGLHARMRQLAANGTLAIERRVCATSADHLLQATPFYWSPHLCDLLENAAASIPGSTFTPDILPIPAGFAWFSMPLALEPDPLCALSWLYQPASKLLEVLFFVQRPGAPAGGYPAFATAFANGVALLPDRDQYTLSADGHSEADNHRRTLALEQRARYLATMFSLLSQRLVVTDDQPPERATRRRLERRGEHDLPLIRVVRLRAAEPAIGPTGSDAAEWSCRWWVRGHWRRRAKQPMWVTSYVKGPPGKPFRPPRTTVYAVTR